jgi:hypothetical protein
MPHDDFPSTTPDAEGYPGPQRRTCARARPAGACGWYRHALGRTAHADPFLDRGAGRPYRGRAFGETSGGFRKLIQIVFGLSIAFAATSFFLTFFSFGGGALIQ